MKPAFIGHNVAMKSLNQQHIMYWNGIVLEKDRAENVEPTTYNVLKHF